MLSTCLVNCNDLFHFYNSLIFIFRTYTNNDRITEYLCFFKKSLGIPQKRIDLNHDFYVECRKCVYFKNLKQINNKRILVNLFKDIVLVTRVRIFCTALFTNNNIKVVTVDFNHIKLFYLHILLIFSNSSFIQYCDSNIGLFFIVSCKFIALPTIATAKVVALKGDSEE